jgi:hypothetical protein
MGCSVLRGRDVLVLVQVQVQSGQEWVVDRRQKYGAATSQRTRGTGRWGQKHGERGASSCAGDREGCRVLSGAGASDGLA